MKIFLIANPVSGRSKESTIREILEILQQEGHSPDLHWTQSPRDGVRLARQALQENAELVIGVGGDGTINEVANGLAGTDTPLGIIPLGTANCLALEIGIPLDSRKAALTLLKSKPKRIHLGQAGDTFFILMAGIGYDGEIVYRIEANSKFKRRWGKLAFCWIGIECLFQYKPDLLKITLDQGESHEGYFAVIGNAHNYGGRFKVTPEAALDKECLDLCLFQRKSLFSMLRYSWGIIRGGKHIHYPDVLYRKAEEIRIESSGKPHVQIDGDYCGTIPMNFRVVPDALTIYIPDHSEL